jgi:hypothetical protein
MTSQVRSDQVAKVISTLEELKAGLNESAATQTQKTIDYYGSNQSRMQYVEGEKRGEPVGSGAIESTCRQLQCRMKRCDQFWSIAGDEALLCLEAFWRTIIGTFSFPTFRLRRPPAISAPLI